MAKSGSLQIKIFLIFFLVMCLIISLLIYKAHQNATDVARQRAFNLMVAMRESKKNQIEWYFEYTRRAGFVYSNDQSVVQAMKEFRDAFNQKTKATKEKNDFYRQQVRHFYENDFLKKYFSFEEEHKGTALFLPSDDRSIELQYKYIIKNPHTYLQKDKMIQVVESDYDDPYDKIHAKYHSIFKEYADMFGFQDLMLIDHQTGFVVYSVGKKVGFATNLLSGPYKDTGLASLFKEAADAQVNEFVKMSDFEPYPPAFGKPTSFITSPIFDGKTKVGVFIAHNDIDDVNKMVEFDKRWRDVGLGESGEVYLIGSDYKVRSTSRVFLENPVYYYKTLASRGVHAKIINKIKLYESPILLHEITEYDVREALKGRTDVIYAKKNYYGNESIIAYTNLKIKDLSWFIIALIDAKEVIFDIVNKKTLSLIVLVLLLLLFFSLFFFFCLRYVFRPLNPLLKTMNLAAQKSEINPHVLGEQVSNDELGLAHDSFQELLLNFSQFLDKIRFTIQKYKNHQDLLFKLNEKISTQLSHTHKGIQGIDQSEVKNIEKANELEAYVRSSIPFLDEKNEQSNELRSQILFLESERKQEALLLNECSTEGKQCLELLNNCMSKLRKQVQLEANNALKDELIDIVPLLDQLVSIWKNTLEKIARISVFNDDSFQGLQKTLSNIEAFLGNFHKLQKSLREIAEKTIGLKEKLQGANQTAKDSGVSFQILEKQLIELQAEVSKISGFTQQLEQLLVVFKVS